MLQVVLDDSALAWDIWSTGEDVETAVHRFESAEGRELHRCGPSRAQMRRVTTQAALAVLMRQVVEPFFASLYGDFERIIPAKTLYNPDTNIN